MIATSAGPSGAFAARGVKRGDVVMTLVGNRIEGELTLLRPAYLSVQIVVARSGEEEVVGQQVRAAGRPPLPATSTPGCPS